MTVGRAQLVVAASGWRARTVQRLEGIRAAQPVLRRLASAHFPSRAPRMAGDPAVAASCRPIHFPQHGHGEMVVSELPPIHSDPFVDLVARSRRKRRVVVDVGDLTPSAARSLLGLVAAGTPVVLPAETVDIDATIGSELVELLRGPAPDDRRGRELRSITTRRLAHDRLFPRDQLPVVSVLLATRRPDDLGAALAQIRRQRGCQIRLLVGLHGAGFPADDDLGELPAGTRIHRFGHDHNLGEVLDQLTAQASTELVTKWDDDDWYGIDHVADLVRAYDYSGADLVGKGAEFIRLERSDVTLRRFAVGAEAFGWTLAGGTMLTSRSWLATVGGWPPVPAGVDRALIDATREAGGLSYRTHGFQYVLRRRADAAHTWAADDAHFLDVADDVRRGLDLEFADVEALPD